MKHAIFESKDFYKDYAYAVILTRIGNRCGYVRLPSANPFYGEHYDDIPYECHGGLTFSGDHLPTLDPSDEYWVGFDCGHYGDAPDVDGTIAVFPDLSDSELEWLEMRFELYDNGKVWSTEDVIKECKHIIDQIIEQEGGKE